MYKIIKFFRRLYCESEKYINQNKAEIAKKNSMLLINACYIYTVVFLGYFIMEYFIFNSKLLNSIYVLFFVMQLIFNIVAFMVLKINNEYKVIRNLCTVFSFLMMSFVILISVYPFINDPGIYFSPVVIVLSILFIFSLKQNVIMLTSFCIAYYILSALIKTPQSFIFDSASSIITWIVGMFASYMLHSIRIRENKIMNELKYLSSTDKLTGICNKATAEYLCKSYLFNKSDYESFALFVVDIDDFKSINDNYGHIKGDEVLCNVGRILKNTFNNSDIVGRVGGDEFLVMMKNISNTNIVLKKADNIQKSIKEVLSELLKIKLSCSIGVVLENSSDKTYEEVFDKADRALYSVKGGGKGNFKIYNECEQYASRAYN